MIPTLKDMIHGKSRDSEVSQGDGRSSDRGGIKDYSPTFTDDPRKSEELHSVPTQTTYGTQGTRESDPYQSETRDDPYSRLRDSRDSRDIREDPYSRERDSRDSRDIREDPQSKVSSYSPTRDNRELSYSSTQRPNMDTREESYSHLRDQYERREIDISRF